ncbi:ABC transporter permease [Antarctobacter sp.]|uniref:ABC transporter permease n=1 Tax=Antarctobacter sp. TaxID=1872577 RepID=UPI003A908E53
MTDAASQPAVSRPRRIDFGRLPLITISIVALFIFAGVFAPLLVPYDPNGQDLLIRLKPPSADHWFGTDALGRDVFSRIVYGARVSLVVVFFALLGGAGLGMTLGVLAGYFGGITDVVISRVIDAAMSIPSLFIGILLAVSLGGGIASVIIAISLIMWSSFARVIRADVIALKNREFIILARLVGCSHLRILLVHVLPNIVSTAMVLISINLGEVILMEAGLSFLGAGIPPPTASWGSMVAEGQGHLARAWWLTAVPGTVILLVVLAFNILGDWTRDRLDPRLRDRL